MVRLVQVGRERGEAVGQRGLLPAGSLVIGAAGAFSAPCWQAFVMMGVLGAGVGLRFAAIPGLMVRAVPGAATGSALGAAQVAATWATPSAAP